MRLAGRQRSTDDGEDALRGHWVRGMRATAARLLAAQKVRFLIVGGINTVLGYGLFVVFNHVLFGSMRFGYILSLICSYALSIMSAFVLYRRYVFPVTGRVRRDFIAFVGVNMVAVGSNLVLLPALVEVARMTPLVAQGIALVCTTLISFFGHRDVSFRRLPEPV